MIDEINRIKALPDYSPFTLYLLSPINDSFAFFFENDEVVFGQYCSDDYSGKGSSVETESLSFFPKVRVSSVGNNQTYKTGFYNLLFYKGHVDDSNFGSFAKLCSLYAAKPSIGFEEFISSLIEIFQLPKDQSILDVIGLFGELAFLKEFYFQTGVDLSNYWHVSGIYSRFDVSAQKFNLEIKTTASDSTSFDIKHEQIFDGSQNYVAVVRLKKEESGGLSLKDLVSFAQNNKPFCDNLNFQIALEKELKKNFGSAFSEKRFSYLDGFVFDSRKMTTISGIPFCVSHITYLYDFDLSDGLDLPSFSKIASGLLK